MLITSVSAPSIVNMKIEPVVIERLTDCTRHPKVKAENYCQKSSINECKNFKHRLYCELCKDEEFHDHLGKNINAECQKNHRAWTDHYSEMEQLCKDVEKSFKPYAFICSYLDNGRQSGLFVHFRYLIEARELMRNLIDTTVDGFKINYKIFELLDLVPKL